MKRSELKQLIREEIQNVLNEIDLKKPFGVVQKGGSIGGGGSDSYYYKGERLIDTFDSLEDAKAYAKLRRSRLTPGEKGYYKMGYTPVKLIPGYIKKG
jgi:hypothetical protein